MIKFFGNHLGGLLDFSGREAPKPFWLWVAFNVALQTVMTFSLFVPMFVGSFAKMEQFANEHPDKVTRTYGPGSYSIEIHGSHPELMPDVSSILPLFGLGALITVVLLAASVARRLHDSNRSGLWGLIPLPFLSAGFVFMGNMFKTFGDAGDSDMTGFFVMFVNNLVYLSMLGLLVYFCAQPSTPGENRFGPPSAV